MILGLPWASWLLMLSPAVLGLGLALRFHFVRRADPLDAEYEVEP